MATIYRTFLTNAELTTAERALWTRYYDAQRTARGLAPGASLDQRQGRTVAAVTARYDDPVLTSGQPGGCMPYNDRAQQFAADLAAGGVPAASVPAAYRAAVLARGSV